MMAFLKKEWMELVRTGKGLILLLIFVVFGIMNPAIAKLTPWMMEMMSDSLASTGLVVGEVAVDAATSWAQFYKNIPMALIVIVLMFSGIFTGEYQSGTLVQVVTKGLSRWKILFSKMVMTYGCWTALYLICYGITYGYNAYFWDNGIMEDLFSGTLLYWLFGMVVLSVLLLFSTMAQNAGQALMGTGGVFLVLFFASSVPKLQKFLPFRLMDGLQISVGAAKLEDYYPGMLVGCAIIVACAIMSVPCFNRKRL